MKRPSLLLIASTLLLAGCLGSSDGAKPTVSPPATSGGIGNVTEIQSFAMQECTTFHLVFPSPASPFEPFVPKGFTMKTEGAGGAVVNTISIASLCRKLTLNGNGTQEVVNETIIGDYLVQIPVVPPANLRNASFQSDYAVVALYNTNASLRQVYDNAGLKPAMVETAVTLATPQNTMALRVDTFQVRTPTETYSHTIEVPKKDDTFAKGQSRIWSTAKDGTPVGFMRFAWIEARGVGVGTVEFGYTGPGGAPPVHQGVAHLIVRGATEYAYEALTRAT